MSPEIEKKIGEIAPLLSQFTNMLQKEGVDNAQVNVSGGKWVYFQDGKLLDMVMGLIDTWTDGDTQINTHTTPSKKDMDVTEQELQALKQAEYLFTDYEEKGTDIKKLRSQYGKENIEKIADRAGFKCDWKNNKLIKK